MRVRIAGAVGFNFLRENRGSRVQSAAAFLLLYKTFYQGVLPFERRINAVDPGCRGLVINNERAGAAAFVSMAERGQGASHHQPRPALSALLPLSSWQRCSSRHLPSLGLFILADPAISGRGAHVWQVLGRDDGVRAGLCRLKSSYRWVT